MSIARARIANLVERATSSIQIKCVNQLKFNVQNRTFLTKFNNNTPYYNNRKYFSSTTCADNETNEISSLNEAKPRVCIIGSGPSALYTVKYVLRDLPNVTVDIIERLPIPYGLVRFGVAPDHPEAKIVINDFHNSVLTHPNVNFRGNIEVGVDVTLEQLREHYDAVVLAVGARESKKLGIAGENLSGVHDAREFVAWYNGHPDMADMDFDLENVSDVVVIGNGNVALDVSRILLKTPEEISLTDIPLHVREKLHKSNVSRIGVYGRRGPVQGAYTIAELREISTAALRPVLAPFHQQDAIDIDQDVSIDDNQMVFRSGLIIPQDNFVRGFNEASEEEASARALKRKTDLIKSLPEKIKNIGITVATPEMIAKHTKTNNELISKISFDPENPPENKPIPNDRTLVLDYLMNPVRFEADPENHDLVKKVIFERVELEGEVGKQKVKSTGDFVSVPSSSSIGKLLVLTSVGYRSVPLDNAPFDKRRNIFPTVPGGKVVNTTTDNTEPQVEKGLYATGWSRRGPTGIIGTNIGDARETAGSVCEDIMMDASKNELKSQSENAQQYDEFWKSIESKKYIVDKQAYQRIHNYETQLGASNNVHQIKVAHFQELLEISKA